MHRISLRQLLKEPLHPAWIVLAIVELAVIFTVVNHLLARGFLDQRWLPHFNAAETGLFGQDFHQVFFGSYLIAGGERVGEGIMAWSGKASPGEWRVGLILVISSMIFSFIVGPSLLLWGLTERKNWMEGRRTQFGPSVIVPVTALGGYLLVGAFSLPLGGIVTTWNNWKAMEESSARAETADATIATIVDLGCEAQVLHANDGFGGTGWKDSTEMITIDELRSGLPLLEQGEWFSGTNLPVKFLLEVERRDSITIWAVSELEGLNLSRGFKNKDGTSGNQQFRAGITPDRINLMMEN